MAMKSGISHSLATLVLTLLSALLLGYLKHIGVFEGFFDFLTAGSLKFSMWLESSFDIVVNHEMIVPVVVASVLAFVWGIVYHFARSGK